jgi:hypothetical protein
MATTKKVLEGLGDLVMALDGLDGLSGGRRKRRKKGARKASRKGARKASRKGKRRPPSMKSLLTRGFRVVSKKAGTRGKGRLKKGCLWGRGEYKGKVLCRRPGSKKAA